MYEHEPYEQVDVSTKYTVCGTQNDADRLFSDWKSTTYCTLLQLWSFRIFKKKRHSYPAAHLYCILYPENSCHIVQTQYKQISCQAPSHCVKMRIYTQIYVFRGGQICNDFSTLHIDIESKPQSLAKLLNANVTNHEWIEQPLKSLIFLMHDARSHFFNDNFKLRFVNDEYNLQLQTYDIKWKK